MRQTNFVDFECPQHSRAFENIFTRRKEVRIIAQMSFRFVEKNLLTFFALDSLSEDAAFRRLVESSKNISSTCSIRYLNLMYFTTILQH